MLKRIETWLRAKRRWILKRIFQCSRGRKLILDVLPEAAQEIKLDCGDHVITFNPHEMLGRHVFAHGQYDRPQSLAVLRLLTEMGFFSDRRNTIVEIGANIGTQTVYFSLVPGIGRIVAIEPDPVNLRFLEKNVSDNGLTEQVVIVPAAVAQAEGEMNLYRIKSNSGSSSLLALEQATEHVRVKTRRLDAILADLAIDAADVSLIWMDVEGYEPELCVEMQAMIAANVPLHIEFSPSLYGAEKTANFVSLLQRHYESVLLFFRNGEVERRKTDALRSISRQCDVLLIDGRTA